MAVATIITRKDQIVAIITAGRNGLRYCPSCGVPLNHDRGGLPNSSAYNEATDTVTCLRCTRRPAPQQPDTNQEHTMGLAFGAPREEPAPAIASQPDENPRHAVTPDFTKPAAQKDDTND